MSKPLTVWRGTYTDKRGVTDAIIQIDSDKLAKFLRKGRHWNPAFDKCRKKGTATTTRLGGGVIVLLSTPTTKPEATP